MGEIDTKSIESVQAALCYFGEKNEARKLRSLYRDLDLDSHNGLDELRKELANCKIQLEAKGSENLQALLNLQHYKKVVRELSAKLEECEAERDEFKRRVMESRVEIHKLEIERSRIADQLVGASKVEEELSQAYVELKTAQAELIRMREQIGDLQELEHQLLSKTLFVESLQLELQQAREFSSCSEEDAAKALEAMKMKLKAEERKTFEQLSYIEALNMELGLMRVELKNTKDDAEALNSQVENLMEKLESEKRDSNNMFKMENDTEKFIYQSAKGSESDNIVAIPLEDYRALLAKGEKADKAQSLNAAELRKEVEMLKKEHEAVMAKVNEFRTRAEQAVTRAESAERAKLAVEGQLRKWREQKQRRKAALAALKEETHPAQTYLHRPVYDDDNDADQRLPNHQPLGKVLNMKF